MEKQPLTTQKLFDYTDRTFDEKAFRAEVLQGSADVPESDEVAARGVVVHRVQILSVESDRLDVETAAGVEHPENSAKWDELPEPTLKPIGNAHFPHKE